MAIGKSMLYDHGRRRPKLHAGCGCLACVSPAPCEACNVCVFCYRQLRSTAAFVAHLNDTGMLLHPVATLCTRGMFCYFWFIANVRRSLWPYHWGADFDPCSSRCFTGEVGKHIAPVWSVCPKQHREVAVKIVLAALKTVRDQVGTGALDPSKLTSRHLPRVVRAKIGTLVS